MTPGVAKGCPAPLLACRVGDEMAQLGFEFEVQPRRLTKVTPARLATFEDCPRRYRLTYLDRPTPQRSGPWAHSTMGAAVHNALRALFDLAAGRRTPARAADLVEQHWKDAGFADTDQSRRYRDRAKRWVGDYAEQHDLGFEPAGVERWISAPTNPQPDAPPSMIVEGRADRIDIRDGELVIVDYKTGKSEPDRHDARAAPGLALYAVAATRTLRTSCHRVELHHLPTGTVAAAEHTGESLRRHLRRAEETAEDIRLAADTLEAGGDKQELFPARPARRCAWCDFRPSCAEGRAQGDAANGWDLLAP